MSLDIRTEFEECEEDYAGAGKVAIIVVYTARGLLGGAGHEGTWQRLHLFRYHWIPLSRFIL